MITTEKMKSFTDEQLREQLRFFGDPDLRDAYTGLLAELTAELARRARLAAICIDCE